MLRLLWRLPRCQEAALWSLLLSTHKTLPLSSQWIPPWERNLHPQRYRNLQTAEGSTMLKIKCFLFIFLPLVVCFRSYVVVSWGNHYFLATSYLVNTFQTCYVHYTFIMQLLKVIESSFFFFTNVYILGQRETLTSNVILTIKNMRFNVCFCWYLITP